MENKMLNVPYVNQLYLSEKIHIAFFTRHLHLHFTKSWNIKTSAVDAFSIHGILFHHSAYIFEKL